MGWDREETMGEDDGFWYVRFFVLLRSNHTGVKLLLNRMLYSSFTSPSYDSTLSFVAGEGRTSSYEECS